MFLKGKVAIVTGAKRGIGKEIAKQLALNGADLALCSLNTDGVESVIEEIQSINNSIKIIYNQVDIRDSVQVSSFIEKVVNQFSKIDILINNAGIVRSGSIISTSETDWNLVIDTNLKGVYLLMNRVIPEMKKNALGHIINISSICGKTAFPYLGAYTASKFGLIGLSLSVKEELRKENIHLSIIHPGAVDTDIWGSIPGDYNHSLMVRPDEIAKGVLFILQNSENCTVDELQITPKPGMV
ncbi:MAG: SDR family oxidoreductase [Cyanobacteriota bacterium]